MISPMPHQKLRKKPPTSNDQRNTGAYRELRTKGKGKGKGSKGGKAGKTGLVF